jgi:membrane-associated phospholipid phosphatase
MSRHGLIHIPPTDLDVAVAEAAASVARPSLERTMRVLTWLADEKLLLAGVALSWAYVRAATDDREMHGAADEMLCAVAIASVVPHLCKRLFARERPDRTIVRHRGRGIPKSGNAWDSFPSGHAVHVGALAPAVAQIVPATARPLVWPAAAALAGTRLLLLAHYLSDVLGGLALGIVINKSVARLLRRART